MSGLVYGLQNRPRRFESARHLKANSGIPLNKGVPDFLFDAHFDFDAQLTDNYYVNRILSNFLFLPLPSAQPSGRFLAKASVTLRDAERHLQVKEPSLTSSRGMG